MAGGFMQKELPVRKHPRLKGCDYNRNGAYFITFCVKDRHEMLWDAPVGARIARPLLSEVGKVVEKAIENISQIYIPVSARLDMRYF